MTKLILHIGFAKTGTTTLQHCFEKSREALADHGVLYPQTVLASQHVMVIPYLMGAKSAPKWVAQQFKDEVELEKRAKQAWEDVCEGIRHMRPDTVILSSEQLGDMTHHPQFPAAIEQLSSIFNELIIVAYVREPASEYVSYAQEQLKAGIQPVTPDRMASAKYRLAPLRQCTNAKISVQKFVRTSLVGNDIRDDFAVRFLPSGTVDALIREDGEKNVSISAEAMAVLECYVYNEFPGTFQKHGELNFHVVRCLIEIDQYLTGFSRPKYISGVKSIIHDVARDLDWLEDNFGISFQKPEPSRSAMGQSSVSASEMTRVRDYCIVDERRFISLLRQLNESAFCQNKSSISQLKKFFQRLFGGR